MDFAIAQDQARRTSKKLVLLFLASVISLVVITNVLIVMVLMGFDTYAIGATTSNGDSLFKLAYYFSWQRFGKVTLAVTGVIGCAIFYKWTQLSGGGKSVAEQLGGQRVQPNTDNAAEKRLLNVVEEMAIASGMPVPPVYLLAGEAGINAFAAGVSPADAVIGVTRGAVEQFDRHQLQGVIAHEFSHILNGDMRVNIRLVAILHGIVFIGLIGEILMRGSRHSYGSRRRSNGGQIVLLGLALIVVGWLGQFFGNWIKSAVSRQREYLADASAVQFTRNPSGLADALKIIGGYDSGAHLHTAQASEMRHFFFGSAVKKIGGFFATHPPLDHRISLIEPNWNKKYISRRVKSSAIEANKAAAKAAGAAQQKEKVVESVILAGAAAHQLLKGGTIESIREDIEAVSPQIRDQIKEPLGAMAVVCCILLSRDEEVQKRQIEGIEFSKVKGLLNLVQQLYPQVRALTRDVHLPIVELALPALKCLSAPQYKQFRKTLLLLVRVDRKLELFEWCIFELLCHYLEPEFNKQVRKRSARAPLYKKVAQVAEPYRVVLSALFHHGENSVEEGERAFSRGLNTVGLYTGALLNKEDCTIDKFTASVEMLARSYPLLKPRLIKGLVDCAKQDGKITAIEREMISAIAAAMDSPIPKL